MGEEEMPGRTIIALFNPMTCVYVWKNNQIWVVQEVELRRMGGSWRRTDSRSVKEVDGSILRG